MKIHREPQMTLRIMTNRMVGLEKSSTYSQWERIVREVFGPINRRVEPIEDAESRAVEPQ